jgi:hypothetical protein
MSQIGVARATTFIFDGRASHANVIHPISFPSHRMAELIDILEQRQLYLNCIRTV